MLFIAEIAEIFFEQTIDMLDGRMRISLIHHLRQDPIQVRGCDLRYDHIADSRVDIVLGAKDRRRGTEHEVSGMENKTACDIGGLQ